MMKRDDELLKMNVDELQSEKKYYENYNKKLEIISELKQLGVQNQTGTPTDKPLVALWKKLPAWGKGTIILLFILIILMQVLRV